MEEGLTRKYLEHLGYIQTKKEKWSELRRRKKQEEIWKTYNDFDWVKMFHTEKISKLTVTILNLFPDEHHLHHDKMKKTGKVNMINAWLPNSEYHKIEQRE